MNCRRMNRTKNKNLDERLTVKFDDGEATVPLTIASAPEDTETPKTGDYPHLALWYAPAICSLAGTVGIVLYGKSAP